MSKKIEEHQYEEGLQECKRWLENKYDGLTENKEWNDFGLKDIHISKSGFSSGWYGQGSPKRMNGKRIKIGLRGCDLTSSYCKKLEYLTPIGGIYVHRYVGYKHTLLHELTHLIQYIQQRTYSEVETTKNELEYLLEIEPRYEHQLISYEERKRQELKKKEWMDKQKELKERTMVEIEILKYMKENVSELLQPEKGELDDTQKSLITEFCKIKDPNVVMNFDV